MLVDSHCHLDFPDFAGDLDAIVARAEAAGIGRIVTISTRVKRLAGLLAIAERFPNVYCSVGTHPHHADEEDGMPASELIELTKHPKVVALGEAGLDYFYQHGSREAQERGFRAHIAAARVTGLPLVIHTRDADADCGRILEQEVAKGPFRAVLHCYTGGRELAMKAISLGLSISFTGILTFKKSEALRELAANVNLAARRRLGRSLSVREIDAGSCNGCELEIHALNNPIYDLERFGIRFVASPRHADVLLVTGPVTTNMREALRKTYAATPDPKWVIASGDCAIDGGCFAGSYACTGGVANSIPVDLRIKGCPPSPLRILEGLLALLAVSS